MVKSLWGAYTALITPFTDQGSVDYAGLRKNVRYQLDSGIDGLLALGTTAETPTLADTEREEILRIVVEEAKGKVPIMVGTGTNCTRQTIHNTQQAQRAGADMALIVTPYYNKPTQEGIYRHFRAVSDVTDLPIVVYNIPSRAGVNIELGTLERIAALPKIMGVKEASGSFEQMKLVEGRLGQEGRNFSVMSGDDKYTLPLLQEGGDGVISVISNLVPSRVKEMVHLLLRENHSTDDWMAAKKIDEELEPLYKAAFLETNPQPIKCMMQRCGMAAGPLRLPLLEVQEETKRKIGEALKETGVLPKF